MRPLQFHQPIDAKTWLLGGSVLVQWSDALQPENDVLAQWPDGTGYFTVKTHAENQHGLHRSAEQNADSQSLFSLIYEAGDATAVWALGTDTICKIKEKIPNVCSEARIIAFVQENIPSVPVPEVLYTYERDDCYVLFLKRVPGETVRDAWLTLTPDQQSHIWDQVAEYCAIMADVTSENLSGVGETCLLEPYLYARKNIPLEPLMVSQAQLYLDKYNPPGMKAPQVNKFHFYHADLGPGNIILFNGSVAAIVDWESAGFYPRFWIATKPSVSPGFDFHPPLDDVESYQWRKVLKERLESKGFAPVSDWWMEWRARVRDDWTSTS
ncbi:hypothetical protein FH972_025818 [Carpinus fangiana]|uniref:Aminoglycoside phosphotransferase domain-containing protein n=1 Tax=Carpinus fangiana TaxID=176857 RepID=A0A5N6L2I5_9ROSI|nr:hypothetical protein FH972_025818 [Carpinus fangiana]